MGAVVSLAVEREQRSLHAPSVAQLDLAAARGAAASAAARDWLETQARVIEYWRDLLLAAGERGELLAALDAHAAFLHGVTRD